MIRLLVLSIAAVVMLGGCLHAPLPGATKGVVQIANERYWDEDGLGFDAVLTGVAIGEHHVLTAAHSFGYEPAPGHPLKVNDRIIDFEVLSDGWAGQRHKLEGRSKEVADFSMIAQDYLVLRTDLSFSDYANLEPVEFGRLKEIRHATFVTREHVSGDRVAIAIREVGVSQDGEFITCTLKKSGSIDPKRYWISGSPLIAAYPDGTMVLLGIASSSGTAFYGTETHGYEKDDQYFFTPAYRIPWEAMKN